jgi:hypothetical protein
MSDLPRTALERVLARAAELQTTTSTEPGEVISEERLVEIAGEVGLDVAHVRQAIAEERAQLTVKDPGTGMLLASLGPAVVSAQRTVTGTPDDILRRLEAWLPRNEFLTPVRRAGDRMVWEPRRDPVGNVLRSLGGGGRRFDLVRLDQLVISATRIDDGRTVLRFDAIMDGARRQARLATGIVGAMALLLLLLTAVPMFALALVLPQVALVSTVVLGLLGIAGTALTWFGLKKGFRTLLGRVQTRLELLLDEEQQGRLTPAPSLLDKLLK